MNRIYAVMSDSIGDVNDECHSGDAIALFVEGILWKS